MPAPASAPVRRIRYPLALKFAVLLVGNVILLGLIGAGLFLARTGFDIDELFAGRATRRVEAVANVVVTELFRNPSRDRNEMLAPFSAAYGADFYLFGANGTQLAGDPVALPAEVLAHVRTFTTLPEGAEFFLNRGGRGPRPREENSDNPGTNSAATPPPTPPVMPEPPSDRDLRTRADIARLIVAGGRDERPHFLERIGRNPPVYWIGVSVLVPSESGPRRRMPAVLIAKTDPLGGTGLLIDFKPLLIGTAVISGISLLFWLPMVLGMTNALRRVTRTAEAIADGRLDSRVEVDRSDELGRLGETVNTMAARLESHATGQKRFIGDIAHELGSPLARMQFATGILEERAGPELASAVADVREEVQHMSELVNELLAFTKAGLRPKEAELRSIPLAALVSRILDREDASNHVAVKLPSGLHVRADELLLSRALANLVRNAVRYAGPDADIQLQAVAGAEQVTITVSDRGPGVPPEALARLGEPFFRPEAARTRETGGVGLGLAIVRSAIDACGGSVRFSNREPRGFQAEITLRTASAAD